MAETKEEKKELPKSKKAEPAKAETAKEKPAPPKKEAPAIVLPKAKTKALHKSPKNLIIFSLPKVGKTELIAALDNALLLDLEEGSDFVDAMKLQPKTVTEIAAIGKAIRDEGFPYDYVVVDTITALEQMCVPYAEKLYANSPQGKNWFKKTADGKLDATSGKAKYGDILAMPNGAGYSWLRQAYTKMLVMIKKMAPRVILLGHVKDAKLDESTAEMSSMDLDLTGKIKRITTAQSDAIGYLYRKNGTENYLSFKAKGDVLCGARCDHLSNQEILVSEKTEEGLTTHWDKIYID